MALYKSDERPTDAIPVDELKATEYVWDIVANWDSLSDVYAIRYGSGVLGGINALSGLLINNYFRTKLKLLNYGYFSSVVPITIMPGLLTALFHRHLVSTEILLMKNEACPVCFEVRSALIQGGFGTVYPMVLGPTSALMFANRYGTYRVPDILKGPKLTYKFLRQITKPFTGTLAFIGAFQFVASSIVTYLEMKNHVIFRNKLLALEAKISALEQSKKIS